MTIQLIHHGTETVPQAGDRIILNLGQNHAFFVRDRDPMMFRDSDGKVQPGKIAFGSSKGTDKEHAERIIREAGLTEEYRLMRVPCSDPSISYFDLMKDGEHHA